MKKLIFSAALVSALMLGACSSDDAKEETPTAANEAAANETNAAESNESDAEEVEEEKEEAQVEESTSDEKEVVESEVGKNTIEHKNKELNHTFTAGPINGIIKAVQVGSLQVNEDYREMFNNEELVTVIVINAELENTVDDTTTFYFNQARLTTDTGQQVDSEIFLSDSVGGDFLGKVKLEGDVIWVLKHDPNITKVTMHISGPSNSNYDRVGEDFTIEIPVK